MHSQLCAALYCWRSSWPNIFSDTHSYEEISFFKGPNSFPYNYMINPLWYCRRKWFSSLLLTTWQIFQDIIRKSPSFCNAACVPVGYNSLRLEAQILCVWFKKSEQPSLAKRCTILPKDKILKQCTVLLSCNGFIGCLHKFPTYNTFVCVCAGDRTHNLMFAKQSLMLLS